MAFEAGEEKVFDLFVGLFKGKSKFINPEKTEVEYIKIDDEGVKSVRLDFSIQSEKFKLDGELITNLNPRISFFIKDTFFKSKSEKYQYIDVYGVTTWAEDDDTLKSKDFEKTDKDGKAYNWFDVKTARKAYSGEANLIDFIKANLDIKRGKKCQISDVKALINGDYTEIVEAFNLIGDRKIWALAYVRDNKYQAISDRLFASGWQTNLEYQIKKMKEDQAEYLTKNDISFTLKKYVPVVMDDDSADNKDENFNNTVNEETANDLPF